MKTIEYKVWKKSSNVKHIKFIAILSGDKFVSKKYFIPFVGATLERLVKKFEGKCLVGSSRHFATISDNEITPSRCGSRISKRTRNDSTNCFGSEAEDDDDLPRILFTITTFIKCVKVEVFRIHQKFSLQKSFCKIK